MTVGLDAMDKLYRVRLLAKCVRMVGTAEIIDDDALTELGVTLIERFDDALVDLAAELGIDVLDDVKAGAA